ncbi:unnamed protein product [Calypogeia fissa]
MSGFIGSVGSYLFNASAKKGIDSVSDDVDSVGTAVGNFFSRMKGKTQKALPDLLVEYDLPRGLFPKNVLNYEFDETTGQLVVYLPFPCEVGYRDQSVLRFARKVTAILRPGSLTDIDGMKTKIIFWVKVTDVSSEDKAANKLYFLTTIKKTRPFDVHNYLRDGFEVDAF